MEHIQERGMVFAAQMTPRRILPLRLVSQDDSRNKERKHNVNSLEKKMTM